MIVDGTQLVRSHMSVTGSTQTQTDTHTDHHENHCLNQYISSLRFDKMSFPLSKLQFSRYSAEFWSPLLIYLDPFENEVTQGLIFSAFQSRKVDYHNFDQAESDVLFFQERVSAESSLMRFQWCKGGGYMGFEKSGKPMNLKDVHPDSDAAKFMLHPFK